MRLGGAQRCGAWWRCRCPVHGSRGSTLALRDGERGLIVKCWAGCDARDVLAALRRLGLIAGKADHACPHAAEIARRHAAEARDRQRRIALARDIIAASQPADGTPVERYLRARGITILPPVIRYVPMGDPYARHASGGRRPVMVAAVEHVEHGIVGAHRTWLAPDGSNKASLDPVRISTGPIGGGAVRLGGLRPGVPLVITEGVESAMAATELSGWPAWAALSADGIRLLALPPTAIDIVIAVDCDRSGTGEAAARDAAQRWLAEGCRRVRLVIPERMGADPNDLLREAHHVAA